MIILLTLLLKHSTPWQHMTFDNKPKLEKNSHHCNYLQKVNLMLVKKQRFLINFWFSQLNN